MDVLAPLTGLVDVLGRLGLWPSLLAGGIVGLTIAVILLARFGNLWGAVRAGHQAVDLQAELIALVRANRATEDALRRRLDDAERGEAMAKGEVMEMRTQVALLRHQRRRLVTMLREVIATLPEPAVRRRVGA